MGLWHRAPETASGILHSFAFEIQANAGGTLPMLSALKSRKPRHPKNFIHRRRSSTRRVGVERLENRRLLAADFELSSLLAGNGGDGSLGFVAKASQPGDYAKDVSVSASGDVNGDGFADFIVRDHWYNPVDQKGPEHKEIYEGAAFVVYGNDQAGVPAVDLESL